MPGRNSPSPPAAADEAIVDPAAGVQTPDLGPSAVMVSHRDDLSRLRRGFQVPERIADLLFSSTLYPGRPGAESVSLVGPMIGAPYAAMILERLVARGVNRVLYFGWCGALSPDLKIGDIVVPTGAVIEEGTSPHYRADTSGPARASDSLTRRIASAFEEKRVVFQSGLIWTTDAPFRETRAKVSAFQQRGVLAVEMEVSALFTVGRYREVAVGAVLVVSDELSSLTWKPGFNTARFKTGRKTACEVVGHFLRGE